MDAPVSSTLTVVVPKGYVALLDKLSHAATVLECRDAQAAQACLLARTYLMQPYMTVAQRSTTASAFAMTLVPVEAVS